MFENYCLINIKLLLSTFNYQKFYVITYFVKCILDYSSVINYNMTYSKVVYKYFLKIFYKKINKKEYKFQNLDENMSY